MNSNSLAANPVKMDNEAQVICLPTPGNTTNAGHPWAVATVFKTDGINSNQHIWNVGQGLGSSHENIYLRLDASSNLYFGWGREGVSFGYNECRIATNISTSNWYGIYIGFSGARLSASDASAANLADAFDIRLMSSSDRFTNLSSDISASTDNWTSTGFSMSDRIEGDLTIGGIGSDLGFIGEVAGMVATTLRNNVAMPSSSEVIRMIVDPMKWLNDYKVGNPFRRPTGVGDWTSNFALEETISGYSTQVWLMGDGLSGTADAFNRIGNRVYSDNFYTYLRAISGSLTQDVIK